MGDSGADPCAPVPPSQPPVDHTLCLLSGFEVLQEMLSELRDNPPAATALAGAQVG